MSYFARYRRILARAPHTCILALGAKPLDAADHSRTWRVYADPAGHPFCLCSS